MQLVNVLWRAADAGASSASADVVAGGPLPGIPLASGSERGLALNNARPKCMINTRTERRVVRTELVRVAVGRLLNDLNSRQLELPLGL